MSFLQLVNGITAANGAPTAVQAVNTITTVAGASLVDGDRFTIDDGKTVRIFEFDTDGQAKDRGLGSLAPNGPLNVILIPFTGGLSADQIRDLVIAAVNGAGTLDVVASSGGAAAVAVTHNQPGANNVRVFETVANAGFTIAVTTAGSLSGVAALRDRESIDTLEIWTTGGAAPVSLTCKLWAYTHRSRRWNQVASGATAVPSTPIVPVSGNDASRAEVMPSGLANADRLYLDVSGTFSSATVFAHLTSKLQRRTA